MPYEFAPQTDYVILTLKGDILGDESPPMYDQFQAMRANMPKYFVIQCSECNTISPHGLRQLSLMYKELKSVNGMVRMVNANKRIQSSIVANGLDRIFINKLSLRGALTDFGLVKGKEFDVSFINPFLNSTARVLKVQCFTEAVPQKPFLKKHDDPMLMGDVSGIITLGSEVFTGTLAISFPETLFLHLANQMLGEKHESVNEGIIDLVGELANMILGQAKLELTSLGFALKTALPSCVWGKDHQIKHFGGGKCVVLPFETKHGIFYTEVMSKSLTDSAKGTAKAA